MSLRGKVELAGVTHPGQVREHNEDHIVTDTDLGIAMVADGMGGSKAGEVASGMAVELISADISEALRSGGSASKSAASGTSAASEKSAASEPAGDDGGLVYAAESLAIGTAVAKANEVIHQVANTQPQCAGMGTTVVVVLFYDNRLTIAHVGDSRLYRLRGGELEQITSDHSLVQELIDRGFYTREEARESNNKNIVTRALGIAPEVEYDLQEEVAVQGDVFLLCSDGLNDMIDDTSIRDTLVGRQVGSGGDLSAAAQALVDRANDAGGKDNVSVVLARVLKPYPVNNSWFSRLTSWFD